MTAASPMRPLHLAEGYAEQGRLCIEAAVSALRPLGDSADPGVARDLLRAATALDSALYHLRRQIDGDDDA
jgi:hypothetical protein